MSDTVAFCLFGGAVLFVALSGLFRKARPLWTLLTALCVVSGVLTGLALGLTIDELLAPVLLVCAVSMAALLLGKEGGRG